jgi:hypothetical protein
MRGKTWWICGGSVAGNVSKSALKNGQIFEVYFRVGLKREVDGAQWLAVTVFGLLFTLSSFAVAEEPAAMSALGGDLKFHAVA